MHQGTFITFEGPEGAGKTSVLAVLAERLREQGYVVCKTREPGGVAIAEQIRDVILNRENIKMDAKTEALLYAAARRQHLVEKVIPALERGELVLCDRFVDASLVYQGMARQIGIEQVLDVNTFAIDGVMPSLTLLFDLPPEVGLARIEAHKGREVNRLDLEGLAFHRRVREGYLGLVNRFPERIKLIRADQSFEIVCEAAWNSITQHMKKRNKR
ncbi:dTMP kinase [Bacillus fonticola]|uniref:dTMP kinase n=1 Tax=Bacillus fonticola TaxID=2728853 RepID=UPI001472FD07|nr:dTMP kinase [Bacillus fonticola]